MIEFFVIFSKMFRFILKLIYVVSAFKEFTRTTSFPKRVFRLDLMVSLL